MGENLLFITFIVLYNYKSFRILSNDEDTQYLNPLQSPG